MIADLVVVMMLAMAPEEEWWVPACGNVRPLQIGHDVTPPVVLKRVEPKLRGKPGTVVIQAVINDAGVVCAARVVKAFDETFAASALNASRQWKFRPAKLNGKPRACVFTMTVRMHRR